MRRGDAERFFAPRDQGGELLAEKRRWLDKAPGTFAVVTPRGEPLVAALWDMALGWGHVRAPGDGRRELADLGRQWEPDLLLMDRETMTVAGGCVCMPSSWSLLDAAGKTLHEVHELVPRLNRQIGGQIERFLVRLDPGKAFRRENWGLTRSGDQNYHPMLGRRRLDETVVLDEVFLRVEQQLFTGVPGGVLMGIRIETCPLAELAADPAVWRLAAGQLRTMPDDVAAYKGLGSARAAILRGMEEWRSTRG
jgi:hypothetical protein